MRDPHILLYDDEPDVDCGDGNPTLSLSKDDWLKLQGLTAEQYERQCDELIQMHRDDWKRKQLEAEARRIRRDTGYWPDWVDEIYE